MKKLVMGALMSIFALSTFAQTQERVQKSPEELAALRAERLKTSLELTDDQTKKVESALLLKMTKSKEVRAKYPEDKEAAKKEMLPIHQQFKASMKEILTEEQFVKWQEMKKKHHKKGKGKYDKSKRPSEKPKKEPSNRQQNLEVE